MDAACVAPWPGHQGRKGEGMIHWGIFGCGLLGMGIVLLAVPLILRAARTTGLFQRGQDLHHTHQKPVPRLGGLALAAAFVGVEILIAVVWPDQRAKTPGRVAVLVSSLAMFLLRSPVPR